MEQRLRTISRLGARQRIPYLLLALSAALLFFYVSILLPFRSQLAFFMSAQPTLGERIIFVWWLPWQLLATNFSRVYAALLIAVSLLVGIQVSLLAYRLRQRSCQIHLGARSSLLSLGGITSGFIGIGCAACGSSILFGLFGLTTAAAIVNFLPLKGAEFLMLGSVLLLIAIYFSVRSIVQRTELNTYNRTQK